MVAKVGVIVYSTWGHQNTLSDAVFKGVQKSGAEAIMYQFEETLPQEVLTKMYAAPKPAYPVITPDLLAELDGFIFCFPTRYGRAPAQVSTFFDRTGGLWASGKLIGKFGGIATSAGGQHGGHETTVLTTLPFFAHHGVIFVPIGYAKSEISNEESIVGGSPWGASVVAGGKGTLPVLDSDKVVAEYQGENFGTIVNTFLKGKNAASVPEVVGAVNAKSEPESLGTPVVPTKENGTKEAGYTVPSSTTTAPAPVASSPAPAAATSKPVAAAPSSAPKKKSGGIFSMCCGGDGSDLKA